MSSSESLRCLKARRARIEAAIAALAPLAHRPMPGASRMQATLPAPLVEDDPRHPPSAAKILPFPLGPDALSRRRPRQRERSGLWP